MRKKSGFTIVEQAIVLVPEFEKVVRKLEQQVTLRGQSNSTLQNYIRRIALFVAHFGKLPEQIDPEEINEYLAALARDPRSPSRSSFKHMVCGLRYYYRLMGMNKNAIALPSLKKEAKLPVIMNHLELKELFAVPTLLKQRVVLTLIYSAGLRCQEVVNLKISDIDFERKTIHIRQGKYKKDSVVPLAEIMAVGLRKYLKAENPHIWLFNGKEPDGRFNTDSSLGFANRSESYLLYASILHLVSPKAREKARTEKEKPDSIGCRPGIPMYIGRAGRG